MKKRFLIIAAIGLISMQFGCGGGTTREQASSATGSIPKPEPAFTGKIGETFKDSTPAYPAAVKAPKGAPNVLLILLDDVGFGHTSTFGGPAPTPTLDRLAKGGLRYNRFHTTALCSPTRAALLAGRNHHSVGTGVIIEMGTGYPGYTGIIPRETALVSEMLRQNGFATSMFGKWHNTPETEISPAGPFDRWPTGFGFDYFYGFNQGEAHQYYPTLYRNTTPVDPPKTVEQGYHFGIDMTDETIAWINNIRAADPEKPWFVYYSTGAAHAPHHVFKSWRDKFKGKFDGGWDKLREETFERQKKLGVIPANAQLTPRPEQIPSWDSQSADAKRVYARLMENYIGFLSFTDDQIARIVNSLEQTGQLDNTLIFYIAGDNGASAEGGLEGTMNEVASLVGFQFGLQSTLKRIDDIGGPDSEPHVPVGWAWAVDSPFRWTKQVASHFGGTRNPLVVHWPARIKDAGGLRSQFHHVIDIVPTILEATGVPAPGMVNGIQQKPIEGVSMVYSFDAANANSPGKRTTQYFEMLGNRGVYHDGWMATTRHGRLPWETGGASTPFDGDPWELYNLEEDFTQANDLAAKNPAKVKELQAKFLEEAKKYNVLPLDDRMAARFDPAMRTGGGPPRTNWSYAGTVRVPEPIGPGIWPKSHTITAKLVVPPGGGQGVITCAGGEGGGWSLYVLGGRPVYALNFFNNGTTFIRGSQALPAGESTLTAELIAEGGHGKPATVKLAINGKPVGEGRIPQIAFRWGLEPFEVGRDSISPVSSDYKGKGAFPYGGTVSQVAFELK